MNIFYIFLKYKNLSLKSLKMNSITIKDIKIIPIEKLIEESAGEIFQYHRENKSLYKYLYKILCSENPEYESLEQKTLIENLDKEDAKIIIRHLSSFNLLNDKYRKKFRLYL
jgi:hypothetical protein